MYINKMKHICIYIYTHTNKYNTMTVQSIQSKIQNKIKYICIYNIYNIYAYTNIILHICRGSSCSGSVRNTTDPDYQHLLSSYVSLFSVRVKTMAGREEQPLFFNNLAFVQIYGPRLNVLISEFIVVHSNLSLDRARGNKMLLLASQARSVKIRPPLRLFEASSGGE